jgi:hypothetical protein
VIRTREKACAYSLVGFVVRFGWKMLAGGAGSKIIARMY